MSRALVETYIAALPFVEVAIVGAGRRCRIQTGEIAPGEPVARRFFFRASHVDLLLTTIGPEGLSGKPAAALAELVVRTAATLGAPYQTPAVLRRTAELAVAEITARIRIASQDGSLRQVNRSYKLYRQQQLAKGEKAIPYSAHLAIFTASLVRQVAASGRAI